MTPHWECNIVRRTSVSQAAGVETNKLRHTRNELRHNELRNTPNELHHSSHQRKRYATPKQKKVFNLQKTECTVEFLYIAFCCHSYLTAVQLRLGGFPSSKIFSQFFKRVNYT